MNLLYGTPLSITTIYSLCFLGSFLVLDLAVWGWQRAFKTQRQAEEPSWPKALWPVGLGLLLLCLAALARGRWIPVPGEVGPLGYYLLIYPSLGLILAAWLGIRLRSKARLPQVLRYLMVILCAYAFSLSAILCDAGGMKLLGFTYKNSLPPWDQTAPPNPAPIELLPGIFTGQTPEEFIQSMSPTVSTALFGPYCRRTPEGPQLGVACNAYTHQGINGFIVAGFHNRRLIFVQLCFGEFPKIASSDKLSSKAELETLNLGPVLASRTRDAEAILRAWDYRRNLNLKSSEEVPYVQRQAMDVLGGAKLLDYDSSFLYYEPGKEEIIKGFFVPLMGL